MYQTDNTRFFSPGAEGWTGPAAGDDPRLAAAQEAAVRSFFSRLGRMPTEEELERLVPQFLPSRVVAMPMSPGEPRGPQQVGQSEGAPDVDSVVQSFFDRHGRLPARRELRELLGGMEPPGHWPDVPIDREMLTIRRPRMVGPPPGERGEFPPRAPNFYEQHIQPLIMPIHRRLFPLKPGPQPEWTQDGIRG